MSKFKTHYEGREDLQSDVLDGERFTMKSKTIPNQSLTIRDIMRRYASGIPLTSHVKVGVFDDEVGVPDLPDFEKMDISEIHDFKEYVANQVREANKKITEDMEKAKERKTMELYKKWKADEEAKKSKPEEGLNVDTPS